MPLRAVIKTARLTLRPLQAADEAATVTGIGDWQVVRWLSRAPHPYGPQDFRDFLPHAVPGEVWAIEDAEGFTGLIGLDPHLGYWLVPRAWARGYTTEAARAVLAAYFDDPGIGPARSSHFDGNTASARVLAKLGFRPDGFRRLRSIARPDEDLLLHTLRLTRDDWRASHPAPHQPISGARPCHTFCRPFADAAPTALPLRKPPPQAIATRPQGKPDT